MKKFFLMAAMATLLVACDGTMNNGAGNDRERDSLRNVIDQKDSEINDLMGTFNEIQAGFDLINEAEGRVNMMRAGAENNSSAENIRENMDFIQQTLEDNKRKIDELQSKLKSSTINSSKLKEAINNLTQQLNDKNAELENLRAQLAEKDVKIEELSGTVSNLQEENAQVKQQKEATEEIAKSQDAQLNTAWYVFGTSKELKAEGILSGQGVRKTYTAGAMKHLAGTLTGQAPFTVDIEKGNILISTDLKGISLNLPAPLGKQAGTAIPLRVHLKDMPAL